MLNLKVYFIIVFFSYHYIAKLHMQNILINCFIENLRKTNFAMRQHFSMINQWQNDIKNSKDAHAIEIEQYKQTIAKLNNQIYELENGNYSFCLFPMKICSQLTDNHKNIDTQTKLDDNMTLKITLEENSRLEYEIATLKGLYNKEMRVHQQMLPMLNNKISALEKGNYNYYLYN